MTALSSRALTLRVAFVLGTLCALLGATPALAQQNISQVRMSYIREAVGGFEEQWRFELELEGAALATAYFTPPGGSLTEIPGGTASKSFSETLANEAAVDAKYPPGDYQFLVGDDVIDVTVGLPTFPNSVVTIGFPLDGSDVPNDQPVLVYQHGCTNCDFLDAFVMQGSNELLAFQQDGPALQCSVAFDEFSEGEDAGGPVNQLPIGAFTAGVALFAEEGAIVTSDDGDSMAFFVEGGDVDQVGFQVTNGVGAAPQLDEISLQYRRAAVNQEGDQWSFITHVIGDNFSGVEIHPPCTPLFNRELDEEEPGFFFFGEGPFVTQGQMQESFPATDGMTRYVYVVDGGRETAIVEFDPALPDNVTHFSSPQAGQHSVSETPTFEFAGGGCSNCDQLLFSLTDLETDGSDVLYETMQAGSPPSSISFASLGSNQGSLGPLSGLPDGRYVAVARFGIEDFDGSAPFDLFTGAFVQDSVDSFRVPEPALAVLQLAAVLAVVAAARRRGTA